jgi:hypothetical protein
VHTTTMLFHSINYQNSTLMIQFCWITEHLLLIRRIGSAVRFRKFLKRFFSSFTSIWIRFSFVSVRCGFEFDVCEWICKEFQSKKTRQRSWSSKKVNANMRCIGRLIIFVS